MKPEVQENINTIRKRALSIVTVIDDFKPYSEDVADDLLGYVVGDAEKILEMTERIYELEG